ncbi:MAG: HAD family hydrolase [Acidobacteria bacterium]|nr:MAG: HAD family hydrolase [Acidobacteriota bacterium]
MTRYRAVIFDLDGTLADSYAAIADALNRARAAFGLPAVSVRRVRRDVGHGLEALMARHVGPENVERGVRLFRERYAQIFLEATRPMRGVPEVPRLLAAAGLRLAVASNKPARFTGPIVERLGLSGSVRAVLGPDGGIPPKPEPAMLLRALDLLGTAPHETVYVGDMALDIRSARAAGLDHLLVPTGGTPLGELVRIPGARILSRLEALPRALGLNAAPSGAASDLRSR